MVNHYYGSLNPRYFEPGLAFGFLLAYVKADQFEKMSIEWLKRIVVVNQNENSLKYSINAKSAK